MGWNYKVIKSELSSQGDWQINTGDVLDTDKVLIKSESQLEFNVLGLRNGWESLLNCCDNPNQC